MSDITSSQNALRIGTATMVGACTTIGVFTGLHAPLLAEIALAAPLTLLTSFSVLRFWPKPLSTKERLDQVKSDLALLSEASGIDPKEVIDAITTGTNKLDRILKEAADIRAPNTIRQIKHIDAIGRKIIEDFRVDPKDVRVARSWLNSYLDEMITLVKGYAQLSRTGARSAEAQKQLAGFDEMLDLLKTKFQELLDRLLENDVSDFDVNMTVMRNRLNQEGV